MPKEINNIQAQQGFTLVEVVTVILLIGILAVNVIPRFDSTDSYEAHTHRAQLIAALRLTQQRAMQQTNANDNFCHEIVFDGNRYGIPSRISCTDVFPAGWKPDATGHIVEDRYDITFDINGSASLTTVGFDWMGRPTQDCVALDGTAGCVINVKSAVESLQVTIEPEGYIHVFNLL